MTDKVKALTEVGRLIGQHTSETAALSLLSFIADYQAKNGGNTPSINTMMRQFDTVQSVVERLIYKLEVAGKIHVIARGPLRIMLRMEAEERQRGHDRAEMALDDPSRAERYQEIEAIRQGLGRFIGRQEQQTGEPVSLRSLMEFMKSTNAGWVHRQVEILADRKLVNYGGGKGASLTQQGKMLWRFERPVFVQPQPEEKSVMQIVEPSPEANHYNTRTQGRKIRRPVEETAAKMGAILASAGGASYRLPLAQALGYQDWGGGPDNALKMLTAQGNAVRMKGSKVGLTEQGMAKFASVAQQQPMPEKVAEPAPKRKFEVRYDVAPLTPKPVEQPPVAAPPPVSLVPTADLIMELIERGYTVRKQ